jgi:ABC-type phosphate/phosphonate transport system substrate-binding protein
MVKLGGTASVSHLKVFQGLERCFRRQGIDLDWVLYSNDDAVVDAFVNGDIDLVWNGPLNYVKIKRRLHVPCQVVSMRDADVNFVTHFITRPDSDITTVEDLLGKRFALGGRGSVQAGLLAYYFLKQAGIDPRRDLARCTFHEERQPSTLSDERDVVQRVQQGEYDAGAVCQRTLEVLEEEGALPQGSIRVFWTSPGYSHCCFTAQSDLDPALSQRIREAFLSVDYRDPVGKAVLDAEGCKTFVPGITQGWEMLEKAAEEEGLI